MNVLDLDFSIFNNILVSNIRAWRFHGLVMYSFKCLLPHDFALDFTIVIKFISKSTNTLNKILNIKQLMVLGIFIL